VWTSTFGVMYVMEPASPVIHSPASRPTTSIEYAGLYLISYFMKDQLWIGTPTFKFSLREEDASGRAQSNFSSFFRL
jgi:hypothetical protein